MSRRIQHPNIEINEYDNSSYSTSNDQSLPNAPTAFICGFADKGQDYSTSQIYSMSQFENIYGTPVNEPERYFYNAAAEVVSRGGRVLASKLPYDNDAYEMYNYVDYSLSSMPIEINKQALSDNINPNISHTTIAGCHEKLQEILNAIQNQTSVLVVSAYDIATLGGMLRCINELYDKYLPGLSSEDAERVEDLHDKIDRFAAEVALSSEYYGLQMLDSSITSCIKMKYESSGSIPLTAYDNLKIGNYTAVNGKLRIVDLTRAKYSAIEHDAVTSYFDSGEYLSTQSNDCLGIVPIVVTPANAIYFQNMFSSIGLSASSSTYVQLSGIYPKKIDAVKLAPDSDFLSWQGTSVEGICENAADYFPALTWKDATHIDKTYLKDIAIVVLSAYVTSSSNQKIEYRVVETFEGSLDRNARDSQTGATRFIDNIVNSSSKYINVFTGIQPAKLLNASTVAMSMQRASMLGFYEVECMKKISYDLITTGLSRIFNKCKDPNQYGIDFVVDAGVSNLAQLVKSVDLGTAKVNFTYMRNVADYDWKLTANDYRPWLAICKKFDDFCKSTRKDCMFIADGLRTFCLTRDDKIVRDTDVDSSVESSILPNIKYLVGLNSSYSAGYCNWLLAEDYYTDSAFWCPPSIKAAGIYTYTDTYYHPWDAPAGMNRGMVSTALDTAFNPWNTECDKLYTNAWNYAVTYPIEGVVIEGQKTFQKQKTALDRINVRRLMLYIEKRIRSYAKHYLYEGNTAYLRQKFSDTITEFLTNVKNEYGIIDFAVKCDDENNTADTIDNNELHCTVAVKPVKTIEYIILNFIATSQSATVSEELANNL